MGLLSLIVLAALVQIITGYDHPAVVASGLLAIAAAALLAFRLELRLAAPLRAIATYARRITADERPPRPTGPCGPEAAEVRAAVSAMEDKLCGRIVRLEGMLDAILLPMSLVGPDGKIMWVNKPQLDFLEADGQPQDYIGKDFSTFYYGDSRETVTAKAIKTRKRQSLKGDLIGRKGTKKWISVSSAPIERGGECIGALTTTFDFTRIVEKEHGMARLNQQILDAVHESENISAELSKAGTGLGTDIDGVSSEMDHQKKRVDETATAMEQMNASVLDVAKNASEAADSSGQARQQALDGKEVVGKVVESIQEVQTQAKALKENMGQLGKQAEDIGRIMDVISDIADQTNLLALNAAIEAARAGDAGRGFAVVADEVRKLAEKTMNATKEVGQAISGIQQGARANIGNMDKAVQAVEAATSLAERSGEALSSIVSFIETSSSQVQSIAAASEEQSAASEQITKSMSAVDKATESTLDAMQRAVAHVQHLNDLAEKLAESMHALAQHS